MEEVLELLRAMDKRMETMEQEISALKFNHNPLTTKDFIKDLNKCPGTEFGFWCSKIEVSRAHLKTLLTEKKCVIYKEILDHHLKQNENNCIRVFENKPTSIFIYNNGKWKLMSSKELEDFIKLLYQKVASLNNKCKDEDLGMSENMLYLDRMKKILELKKMTSIVFKKMFHKLIKENTQ